MILSISKNAILVLELSVAKHDLGKIIGVKGRNIGAIHKIMMAVSGKTHKRIVVELVENHIHGRRWHC